MGKPVPLFSSYRRQQAGRSPMRRPTSLFDALRGHLRPGISCTEHDLEINDPTFATRCAERLLGLLDGCPVPPRPWDRG